MKREPFDLGEGEVLILEAPGNDGQWGEVPEALQAITPSAMQEAWRSFPAYFADAASKARLPAFRRWLEHVAAGSARLRLYNTPEPPRGFGLAALLEVTPAAGSRALLDFRSRAAGSAQHPPAVSENEWPQSVPFALHEVHRTVGGIHRQYGASGLLLPPDAMHRLSQLGPYVRDFLEQGRNPHSIEDLLEGYVLYDASGDMMVLLADGSAVWVALESGFVTGVGTVSTALESLFHTLLSGERFVPGSAGD